MVLTMHRYFLFPSVALVLLTAAAYAQEQPQQQNLPTDTAIPGLMFFTIGAALLIGVVMMLSFLRKRSNREAMDKAINPKNPANK
jgi:TRAP-type mannitol/chloroaromatic compound transport system permease small subunit